ncbi:MAG TPA: hypothetical protein V6C99_08525, partial [Oculatellaceae cyanobacterium]
MQQPPASDDNCDAAGMEGFGPLEASGEQLEMSREDIPVPFYQRNPVTSGFAALLVVVYLCTSAPNHFKGLTYWA